MKEATKSGTSAKNMRVVHTALAEALRETTQQFEQKVSELSLVRRVSEIAPCVFDLKRFSEKFMAIILEETQAENCSLMVMDTERNQLVIKAAQGRNHDLTFYDDISESLTAFRVGQGVCGKAASEHKTILINDAAADGCFTQLPSGISIGSLLATPLVDRGKLLGVINISHRRPHALNENNRRVMEVLGRYLSSLIGNAVEFVKVRDQERFRAMSEGVCLAIMLVDIKSGKIIECNSFTGSWLGYGREGLVGQKRLKDFISPQDRRKAGRALKQTAEKRVPRACVVRLKGKGGEEKIGELNAVVISFQDRDVLHVTIQDITGREKAEQALKRSEERYRSLIENANDAIISVDGRGKVIDWNRKAAEMFGYGREEILGRPVAALVPAGKEKTQIDNIDNLLKTDISCSFESRQERMVCRKDGTEFPAEVSYFACRVHGEYILNALVRDISERKELEKKLLQSEKLRSLGELAGGVAHDFNNILATVLGRTQLLSRCVDPPPGNIEKRQSMLALREGLAIIEKAALDGAETVRRIKEFSRRRDDREFFSSVNINHIIDDAIEFTKTKWKDEAESRAVEITVNRDYADVPPVAGSPAELRELFTNLIHNAVDAMSGGGQICLKTSVESGNVIATVKDSGIGVPEDLRDRIFDPFFTTKGLKSTGLGLSVSYGIISRHHGSVKINSIVDEGTTFTISFPVLAGALLEAEQEAVPDWDAQRPAKILVVDDEKSVCETLQDILVFEGHSVETASDGFRAIDRLASGKFDLIFTDMGMPGMTGKELAGEIRKIDRSIPIVLITGWDMAPVEAELKQLGVSAILNKPFKMHDVIRQVAELVKAGQDRTE